MTLLWIPLHIFLSFFFGQACVDGTVLKQEQKAFLLANNAVAPQISYVDTLPTNTMVSMMRRRSESELGDASFKHELVFILLTMALLGLGSQIEKKRYESQGAMAKNIVAVSSDKGTSLEEDNQDIQSNDGDTDSTIQDKKMKTVQWLGLLFLATFALLLFQLLLGWVANAVTLVADAAHTGADVVSYGLNTLIEWLKLPSTRKSGKLTSRHVPVAVRIIDTIGSLANVLILLFVTWFAIAEAASRLQRHSGKGSGSIGQALLLFALVSIAVNVGSLRLYRYWHQKSEEASPIIAWLPIPIANEEDSEEPKGFDWVYVDPLKLEFCPSCTSIPSESHVANDQGTAEGVLQALHMAVHPGCTCGSVDLTWGSLDDKIASEKTEVKESDDLRHEASVGIVRTRNLNLLVAMVHLATDILRSILILGASIVIQLAGVQHAERVDAICALVVGFLICVGSMALFIKVFSRLCSCCQRVRNRVAYDSIESEE